MSIVSPRNPSPQPCRHRHAPLIATLFLLAAWQPSTALAASGQQNPIVAGMEAMLDAMGYQSKSASPFPDDDPFSRLAGSADSGSWPWGSMGGMPGMSPWSSLGGMPGSSPWSSMPGMSPWNSLGSMPGSSPWSSLGGMPGTTVPWTYANPENWSRFIGRDIRRHTQPGNPDSPTRQLDGLWVGQNGERLWFRNGWLRAYRDVSSDARALLRGRYLFIGIPETKEVLQYEYGIRGDYLGLRDGNGNVQLFRRYR